MNLELKHLAPYLPYGLKYIPTNGEHTKTLKSLDNILNFADFGHGDAYEILEIKPILRPLPDLTKEIEINGGKILPYFSLWWGGSGEPKEVAERYKKITTDDLEKFQYRDIEKLFRWHFDVFGLIDNDLAIDINTINS